jgi:hypothetical protein
MLRTGSKLSFVQLVLRLTIHLLPYRRTENLYTHRGLSSSPDIINKPAHDAFTRKRQPLSSENLWNEVKTFVKNNQGVLIIDVLEKPYSQKNGLITCLWSNKEKK